MRLLCAALILGNSGRNRRFVVALPRTVGRRPLPTVPGRRRTHKDQLGSGDAENPQKLVPGHLSAGVITNCPALDAPHGMAPGSLPVIGAEDLRSWALLHTA